MRNQEEGVGNERKGMGSQSKERESELMAIVQHHLKEQSELTKQMQGQHKLMFDFMEKLLDICI